MPLTMEVVGQKAVQMGVAARKVFQGGGTIGRLRDNDWVFPDEYISGHHAKISFANGMFLIEDTSTNGVFINSPQNRMIRGQPYALRNGDTVYIDDYEVRVTLGSESAAVAGGSPLMGNAPFGGNSPLTGNASLIPEDPFFGDSPGAFGAPDDTDPLKLLGIQDARVVPPGPSAASLANNSPMSQHYRPPAASAPPPPPPLAPSSPAPAPRGSGVIPDDYDPFASDDGLIPVRSQTRSAAAVPPPRPASPSPPPPASPQTVVASPLIAPRPAPRPAPAELPNVVAPPVRQASNPGRGAGATPNPATPPNAGLAPGMGGAPRSSAPSNAGASPRAVAPPWPEPAPTARPPPPPVRPAAPFPQAPVNPPSTGRAPSDGSGNGNLDFAALLAAAGIDSERVTPELSQQFGQILRVVVAGLMDVLHAREKIKDEFRMRVTTFKQADNNPLKFSANVEDALHNMLVKRNAAYLGPVEAFEDAFQDLRNHQMAMLAGMRVAYDAMLAEFEPGRLQEEFDRHVKSGSFLSVPAKLRYWELYRNRFHDMVKDADSSFRDLFGDEFAKAYEEQLVRLKTLNRADHR